MPKSSSASPRSSCSRHSNACVSACTWLLVPAQEVAFRDACAGCRLPAAWLRSAVSRWTFLFLPFVFASSVAVSRVYEGIHYPRDVLAGGAIGACMAVVYARLYSVFIKALRPLPRARQVLLLSCVPLACYLALKAGYARVTRARDPAEWTHTATHLPKNAGARGATCMCCTRQPVCNNAVARYCRAREVPENA